MLVVMYDIERRIPPYEGLDRKREYVLRVVRNTTLQRDELIMKMRMNKDNFVCLRTGYKIMNGSDIKGFLEDMIQKYGGEISDLNENVGMGSLVFSKEERGNARRLLEEQGFFVD